MMKEMQKYDALSYWTEEIRKAKDSEKFIWDYCDDKTYEKGSYSILIDKAYGVKLSNTCKNNKLLIYTFLVSTLKINLSKYAFKKNITIGIPCYNAEDKKKIILNKILPLTSYIDYEKTYVDYMMSIKGKILDTYKNQAYLNSSILLENKLSNDIMDLTSISICMKGVHQDKYIDYIYSSSKNELSFLLELLEDKSIKIDIVYNANKLSKVTVENLYRSFTHVLKEVLNNYNHRIKDIKILSKEETNKILYEFNDTKADYPKEKTIQELFEEQVEKTPDNIAVVFEDKNLTYIELNEKVNQLARRLRNKGVKADSIVGIMVERSLEMIIGIMGILKAGGAYLPIDSSYPKERIEYILKDSESRVLLSEERLINNIEFNGVVIDIFNEELFKGDLRNLEIVNNSRDLVYIMYTSGTTGNPKGVMIEHRSLNNLILGLNKNIYQRYNKFLRVSLVAPYYFDASVKQIFVAILSGHSLYIVDEDIRRDGKKLLQYYEKNKIEISDGTPMHIKMMLNSNLFKKNKLVIKHYIIGGEDLTLKTIKEFYKYGEENNVPYISNVYGPTECCVDSSIYLIEPKTVNNLTTIPIGKPMINYKLYIVDKYNQEIPIGIPGELCISGDGLAKGYLNRPELTEEKFVENPFDLGTKMYKTGDLARWLPDGNIEFLGRIDNQVKIRGFRIELEEIENRLLQHEDVKESVVVVKENKDHDKYICAYVASEKEISELNLRSYLKEVLPEYMIPAYFVQLEKMPLTTNGKVDRKALSEIDGSITTKTEYESPRNDIEEKLVAIWSDVLGVDRVGINDDFFELGGHSLKATVLVSKIHKELSVEVPIREIFKSATIKGISEYIEKTERSIYNSIKPVEEREFYEASSAQKRMYMIQQFDLQSTGYNMPCVMIVEGNLNVEKIEKSFNELIRRHETLRTSFESIGEQIVQRVKKEVSFNIEYVDDVISKDDKNELVKRFLRPFDLCKAPLLRVGVIKLEEEKYILMYDMHHIISDGVSRGILIDEFIKIYEGKELESLKIQYKDYSAWQNNLLKSDEMKKQEEYWTNRFSGEIPVLDMPTDYVRPALQSFEGDNINFTIGKEETSKLKNLAKETGSTMYMVLLSNLNMLLSKYSGQRDIIVGSPIAGRKHADLEKIIGMFVNTLAIRSKLDTENTFKEYLSQIKETALKAYKNADYQFEELVEKLDLTRDISRNPLFDVMFVMQNMDIRALEIEGLKISDLNTENKIAKFDLIITASEGTEEIELNIGYSTKLYKKNTIERLIKNYLNIIKATTENKEIKLKDIEIISEEEKQKLFIDFNDTNAEYPKNKNVHELFEEQVEKTPNNIAVVFEDEKITYRELNERANALARTLRVKGVQPDSIVGIMVERSIEMIVGIMGILKSGGAYLPIDPEYPEDRIKYMIKDSKAKVLVTQENLVSKVNVEGDTLNVNDELIYSDNFDNLEKNSCEENIAYIIYTSGTTGNPKGIMFKNKSLVNMINYQYENTNIEFEKVLQFATICFDVATQEILSTLLKGGELYLINKELRNNVSNLLKYIGEKNIETVFLPTIYFKFISSQKQYISKLVERVKHIVVAGEQLSITENLQELIKKSNVYLHNHYGPSETHVVTTYTIGPKSEVEMLPPIGKPISNTRIYILDKTNKIVSIGIQGEICISGDSLSRGYVNNKKLTDEKFVENPFEPGERMYKTGDLARWLLDGNIEFLGRIDHQVKIRGYRIELGEVGRQLLDYEDIKEAIVVDRKDEKENKYLCAYVVSGRELKVGELRNHLAKNLPEYMIPSYFIQLEKMPLTLNGKIDKKLLPNPDGNITTDREYEAPRNEIEEKLVLIWREVLGVNRIGINDNFFELGGHSLKAIVLVSKIHKELSVKVPIREIFKSSTIKGISEYIEKTERSIYNSIKPVEEREYYAASSAQKRMYMIQQFDLQSTGYNMPGAMIVEGNLNVEKLEKAFNELIRRHETLRTSFESIEEQIVQRVKKEIYFNLEYVEDVIRLEDENELVKRFVKPFDLCKAPLLRVGVIKLEEEKYILMYDMHHIISDGVSMGIFINEFVKIYEGKELESFKIQYKDYSEWQNNILKSEEIKKQEEYWIKRFSDEIPVLNMPTDYVRPALQSFEGDSINFKLDKELTRGLKKIAKQTGSTMYMVLLSGVNILLSKYSGQEDIIVGSPIVGRPHADLEKIIGMFVNTLAMRNYSVGEKTYKAFLREVKENALKAYENQDYQFEELVDKLNINRDISRNPLFDVMFTMQNIDSESSEIKELTFKSYEQENKISKFDLTFSASEEDKEISVNLEYCTKLFATETIKRMIEHFKKILKSVSEDINIKISEINMLSEDEKHKLVYEFNNTYVEYPKNKTIHELFEEQVEKTSDNIAVVYKDNKLTYRELNEKANRLARVLREKGVKSDSIVGLIAERSIEMIVGIIGILKAGGAYLPIDPIYPNDRIEYILENSKTELILSQNRFIDKVDLNIETINLDDIKCYSTNKENLPSINKAEDLAYIIYTSGSTGNPKGVMIEHKSLINRLNWMQNKYPINEKDVLLQKTTFTFDVSVWEVFWWAIQGATLRLLSPGDEKSPEEIVKAISDSKVTVIHFVPSMLNIFLEFLGETECLDSLASLKQVFTSGEALTLNQINNFKRATHKNHGVKLSNLYGPTEATIDVSYFDCPEEENLEVVPIGKPIDNIKLYIIEKNMSLSAIGVPGELYISGVGVARGYVNNQKLTYEKFIKNPFEPGERMYKTGDLARWLSDGNIEFLGRIDHQVKIRGFRIELGEIECQLLDYEDIKEAIVVEREDENGNKYLCTYIVSGRELKVRELRNHLAKNLPEYMIPSYFVQVEKIPLTLNGKVDRKALTKPDGSITIGIEYESPRNDIEEKLVAIWSEVLGLEKVGINDNFFELGGHSLKAISLISKVNKELNVEISMREFFKLLTIKMFANYIMGIEKKENKFKHDNVVLIKKGSEQAKNLFLIHDGSGDIGEYVQFCSELNADLNFWGISAESLKNYTPQNITIEGIAEKYLQIIKDIQPNGEYNIGGWSLGGVIAFEIVRQLEKNHEKINNLVLFDSYAPKRTLVNRYLSNKFTIETEKKYAKEFVTDKQIKEKINKETNIENIWPLIVTYFEKSNIDTNKIKKLIPMDIRRVIPVYKEINIPELIHHLNISRTLINAQKSYQPNNKITTQIYLFKASESKELNAEGWDLYCEKTIKYEEVLGTHFTIFKNELVKKFDEFIYAPENYK